ncbi:hypothetical protein [Cryptosporangium arvum]|uniref:hypothetical protein n=1 Tax=Cryptosporangium arvum TaxID=80871 RepID=UPI0004B4780E|nr:hypothetical protein [Cryptosporangium arvum]
MTLTEKRAWITLVVTVVTYSGYVITVLRRADGRALHDVSYAGPLLSTIGIAMVAAIVLEILVGIVTPNASRATDVRDKEIGRLGEYIGQSFVAIGGVAALLMALAEWDWFWIANVIYLNFALAAVLAAVAKVVIYHRPFPL